MLDSKARDALRGVSNAVGTTLGRAGLTPNAVTVAGVALTGVAAWLVIAGRPVAAGLVLAAGGVLDFADGAIARATGRSTTFGAFLDSVSDRVSDSIILSAVAWALAQRGDDLGTALALTSLVLGGLVPYLRAKAESLGLDCSVGIAERAERVIVLIIGLVFDVLTPVLALLAVASLVTVTQRLFHVRRQLRVPR